jgi:hypothetical protein
MEAGVVRVGGGFAVRGVMPSGFAATGAMGSFVWTGIGGIFFVVGLVACSCDCRSTKVGE